MIKLLVDTIDPLDDSDSDSDSDSDGKVMIEDRRLRDRTTGLPVISGKMVEVDKIVVSRSNIK